MSVKLKGPSLIEEAESLAKDRKALRAYARENAIEMDIQELEDRFYVQRRADGCRIIHQRPGYIPPGQANNAHTPHIGELPAPEKSAIDAHRPDSNPKSALGIKKIPLHLVSPLAMAWEAAAFAEGGMKYGPYNFREQDVAATVYIAAALRHLQAYAMGEDLAQDSQIPHLAHCRACCAILIDAQATGHLIDDRYKADAAYLEIINYVESLLPEMAERIKEMKEKLETHQK